MSKHPAPKKPSRKSKSRKPSNKAKSPPVVVHHVALPPTGVLRVNVPPGAMPLIVPDPVKREVVIVPVKSKTLWEKIFG